MYQNYMESGIEFFPQGTDFADIAAALWLNRPGDFGREHKALVSYLSQLEEEGLAEPHVFRLLIRWGNLYQILRDPLHEDSIPLLNLPEPCPYLPALSSQGGLSDAQFAVFISGWRTDEGAPIREKLKRTGAIVEARQGKWLLPESVWRLSEAVRQFSAIPTDEKSQNRNEREWGHIRALAKQAGAMLDNFLEKTVVLTPKTLRLDMRKVDVASSKVVEIQPVFEGAPDRWLSTFDGYTNVQQHYDVPTVSGGIVHVVIEPAVKAVLSEIKRMPGRRVAGHRAEAFIRNPYAVLGEEAATIVPPETFERSRAEAEIWFYTFTHKVCRREGRIVGVDLLIESSEEGPGYSERMPLESPDYLEEFIAELEKKLRLQRQCCVWEGYELELRGETPEQLEELKDILLEWRTRAPVIRFAEVYDLSRYGPRIDGIGEYKPVYSPFIARNNDGKGWLPDNVTVGILHQPEGSDSPVCLPFDKEDQDGFEKAIAQAVENGDDEIAWPGLPQPIPINEARHLSERIREALGEVAQGREPVTATPKTDEGQPTQPKRQVLVLKHNIEALDYEERRKQAHQFDRSQAPALPQSLKQDVKLLEHQREGIAWLQHHWHLVPEYARGCILADDMGLGKTLQLLAFMARCLEESPTIHPVLIVAPVSLLENWQTEMKRFFKPDFADVLLLYGKNLTNLRVPKNQIEERLKEDKGLTQFLKPGWRGDAQIVLTTYETLRDLEFSLAAEQWSIMVCDEAQKIKTPNALVTQAAKKMNATFKIACTGTPVENTLADLWCLFDYVQPGLLGALNEFGRRYRRPIETKTDEERQALQELQQKIDPQVLRRTKQEVAKDLPPKEEHRDCKSLPLSRYQRELYAQAVNLHRQKLDQLGDTGKTGSILLSMLHHLRAICADPKPMGLQPDLSQSLNEYISKSPKLGWLISMLEIVRAKREKVIIFTEFLEIQRMLQHYIGIHFGIRPVIINGDTSTSSDKGQSRQNLIDHFQQTEGFNAIILSTAAIGFGVNIQQANHVIHYTRPWNPAKEDQATDRAYRIGQDKAVTVYYPTVVADDFVTFEEKLDGLLAYKRELAAKTYLNGADELNAKDFSDISDVGGTNIMPDTPISEEQVILLDGKSFELLCSILWNKRGYQTYLTPASGDGGVDVVAYRGNEGVLVQCKSSSQTDKRLGWEAVQNVVAGAAAYQQKHPGIIFTKVSATNQFFNDNAATQAQLNDVELVDRTRLLELLAAHPVSLREIQLV